MQWSLSLDTPSLSDSHGKDMRHEKCGQTVVSAHFLSWSIIITATAEKLRKSSTVSPVIFNEGPSSPPPARKSAADNQFSHQLLGRALPSCPVCERMYANNTILLHLSFLRNSYDQSPLT